MDSDVRFMTWYFFSHWDLSEQNIEYHATLFFYTESNYLSETHHSGNMDVLTSLSVKPRTSAPLSKTKFMPAQTETLDCWVVRQKFEEGQI